MRWVFEGQMRWGLPSRAALESGTVWYTMFDTTCVNVSEGRPDL